MKFRIRKWYWFLPHFVKLDGDAVNEKHFTYARCKVCQKIIVLFGKKWIHLGVN